MPAPRLGHANRCHRPQRRGALATFQLGALANYRARTDPVNHADPLGLETGWVTANYPMDLSKISACEINAAAQFYVNLIPFAGLAVDFAKGSLSDAIGGLGSTIEGAMWMAEGDAAAEAGRAEELRRSGMYLRQQRIASSGANAARDTVKALRPLARSLGLISLAWNLSEYNENSKQCECTDKH